MIDPVGHAKDILYDPFWLWPPEGGHLNIAVACTASDWLSAFHVCMPRVRRRIVRRLLPTLRFPLRLGLGK